MKGNYSKVRITMAGEDMNKLDNVRLTQVREREICCFSVLSKHRPKAPEDGDLMISYIRNHGIVPYDLYYLSVSPYTTRAPQRAVLLTRSMARSRVSRAFRTMESPI